MPNFNKVILVGNLTRDPQLAYLPSQTPVCEFGIAVNRRWKGSDGQPREETCFIECRCYGKQAETFKQHMSKGKCVLIEGRLQLDTWEGQDGQRHSKHRIAVQRFQFLDQGSRPKQATEPPPETPPTIEEEPIAGDEPTPPEDDIPF